MAQLISASGPDVNHGIASSAFAASRSGTKTRLRPRYYSSLQLTRWLTDLFLLLRLFDIYQDLIVFSAND